MFTGYFQNYKNWVSTRKNICNFGTLNDACHTKIGLIALQTKTVHLSLLICLSMLCPFLMTAQEFPSNNNAIPASKEDSIKIKAIEQPLDALSRKQTPNDTTRVVIDSVRTDSIKVKKEALTDKVTYKATDYERISRSKKKIFLYNEAEVTYEDIQINAGEIILDYEKNTVFAKGVKDSSGVYTQIPVFKQGDNEVVPDSIKFNFDSEKALIYGSRVEGANGQEINLKSEISKRVNDSVVFMSNVKITTSKNLDDPEYYFYARKVKFVPGQKLVTGLTNMYIADVPTPIGLPFAFFPLDKQQSVSGFIIPSPGETRQRGYFLQNGGYYFALSDYYNLAVTGDYYTNGSYALRADSDYRLRYRFNGRLSFNFEKILASERGLPDFSESNTYNIRWNHTQDAKASPNSRFSASVNLGSSNFFQQSLNQSNTGNFLTNNFSSSVSYSRTFTGKTPVNVTVAATHSQNSQTEVINLTLPSAQVNVDRIFPFAPKSGSKKGIFQNINLNYSLRANNQYTTTDSLFFTSEMFRDGRSSIQQTIPISTNFKIAKYISATLSANYTENTVFKTIDQRVEGREIVRDTINGIDSYRTYGTSASLGTTIYGFFNFKKGSKIESIRHVVRPNIGISYTPAFDQFFETLLIPDPNDPTAIEPTEEVEFSRFDGSPLGAPSNRKNASLSLSLSNVVEAKVKDKDTSATEEYRKITLLRNLNLRTAYNITADSLRLAPISVSGAIPIIDNKLEINFSAGLDIYALNSNNRRINTLNINNGGSLFRITGARANFGYNFSSKDFERNKDKNRETDRTQNQTFAAGGRPDNLFGGGVDITGNSNGLPEDDEDQEEQEVEFYNFKIPWNLRVSYEVSYVNSARQNNIGSHSLVFSGDIELGKRWTVGGSSGYDLANPGFTFTSLQFGRDLESWNLRFNWVPFSNRSSWNFFIGIKGNLLRDIKYDKRRAPDERL